jgi:hypothetical protein
MSWNYDKEPIDYLRARIKYYRGRQTKVMNLIKRPQMIEKYGEDELRHLIARRLLSIESYLAMFRKAVKDLETIEEMEDKINNHESLK